MTIENQTVEGVTFSSWYMDHLRIMGTMQVCSNCGRAHKGSLATEPYVICTRGGQQMSVKLSDLLRRYCAHLGCSLDEANKYLPELETRVQWVERDIPHCESCFTGRLSAGPKALPRMLPTEVNYATRLYGVSGNVGAGVKKKPAPKPKPTLTDIFGNLED